MKLGGVRGSSNVEDRRASGGGGGGGRKIALSGGTIVVVLIISAITGINPLVLLNGASGGSTSAQSSAPVSPTDDASALFVSQVLATTEDTWNRLLPGRYREPKLVLFRGSVDSACGYASSAVGPFYCPSDEKAYLDLTFFDDLSAKFGAPGDFAAAYVVAHEIGHHIQKIDGTSARVHASGDNEGATSQGVRLELQADCYAGVWAHDAQQKKLLEAGDVDEAMRAAQQIGDDTLQKRGRGRVAPDSFTHGSAVQRAKWFKLGMAAGDPKACDTFNTRDL